MKYYYTVVTWSHTRIPNQIVKGNVMTLLLDKHPLLYLKELDDRDYFEENKEEWVITFFSEVSEEVFNLCKDYHS